MTIDRADLLAADPAEISDHLLAAGLTGIKTWRMAERLRITADQGDAAITAALVGFTPRTSGFDPARPRSASWRGSLPAELRAHVGHLRDYRNAVRAGTPVTNAQTQHVIADLIDALRLLVRDDVLED